MLLHTASTRECSCSMHLCCMYSTHPCHTRCRVHNRNICSHIVFTWISCTTPQHCIRQPRFTLQAVPRHRLLVHSSCSPQPRHRRTRTYALTSTSGNSLWCACTGVQRDIWSLECLESRSFVAHMALVEPATLIFFRRGDPPHKFASEESGSGCFL